MRKFTRYCLLSIVYCLLSAAFSFSQCTLTVTPTQTNILCNGANTGAASVAPTGGTPPYTYSWTNGASTSTISNLAPGTYTSTVIDASCIVSGIELVNNGDFNGGNSGFVSAYTFTPPPNTGEGQYWIAPGSSVNSWNGGMFSLGDHTTGTGNFMLVNGAGTPGSNVWCQTIPVTPNTNYNFSTWVSSLNNSSPAMLQFSTNGIPLGPIFNAPATWGPWQQFFSVWNSGANTSVTICVENMNTVLGGNDFGLDDISFMSCAPCTVTNTITITEPPPLAISGSSTDEYCSRSDGTVAVAAAGGTGAYTYVWNPGAATTAAVSGLATANYSVTVSDANGCIRDTVLVVNFVPGPTAAAGVNVSVCTGNLLTLNASGGGTYLWSPVTGLSNTTSANPIFSGTATTTYTVMVTDANNCTSLDDVTVTVYQTPEVSFTAAAACFTNANQFTGNATGTVAQWSWNFGEPASGANNVSSLQNPTHTYGTPGLFVVTLVAISPEGCSDTITGPVTVHPLPQAGFSSTTVCIGSPTAFTDLSTVNPGTINTWSWNFGDPASGAANTSNIQNPTHVFTAVGLFNVLLTVTTNNGCQSASTFQALVLFPPVASYTFTNACLNAPTTFTDQSTNATNWAWNFGDGGISNAQNPTHTYLSSGNFVVTLIASSTGTCADTVTDTVMVYPLPVVQFLSDTVCLGDSSTFFNFSYVASGSISTWHWDFGDGDTSALQNPMHEYPASGSFTATLTATSANGCVDSASGSVLVHPLPTADFSFVPDPTAQLIDMVSFTDLSSGPPVSWWWEFGDGDTSTFQNPSHFYSDTGNFVVTLVVASSNGCLDTMQRTVEVRDFAFYMPNTFTPNGDDINELFFGKGVGILEFELTIFDRWGNRIFYCKVKDLPQTLPCMWDGKVEGGASNKTAQQDVYVWKVKLISTYYQQYDYIGNVNIIR